MNETDVREDIAAPFLSALGYARGTPNDIGREVSLRYAREYLGRKNERRDPPLRGRADYVLSVLGVGRWVLEVKAPHEPIDVDAIEQAITYARHPEVSAEYAAVLNGRRMTIHRVMQLATEAPILDVEFDTPPGLAEQVSGVLSPASLRRDLRRPPVDVGMPLGPGLRSRAEILRGHIVHNEVHAAYVHPFVKAFGTAQLDESLGRLKRYRNPVTGGFVERAGQLIRARITWEPPHDELLQFTLNKRLMDADYVALSNTISDDVERPTAFDVVGEIAIARGESLFDLTSWTSRVAGADMLATYQATAVGYLKDYVFEGTFSSRQACSFPAMPIDGPAIEVHIEGSFRVEIDGR